MKKKSECPEYITKLIKELNFNEISDESKYKCIFINSKVRILQNISN